MEYVEDIKEKSDTPCWVGFPREKNDQEKIRLTFEEAEAGIWVLRGWDVGYLPGGLVDAVKIEWIT